MNRKSFANRGKSNRYKNNQRNMNHYSENSTQNKNCLGIDVSTQIRREQQILQKKAEEKRQIALEAMRLSHERQITGKSPTQYTYNI